MERSNMTNSTYSRDKHINDWHIWSSLSLLYYTLWVWVCVRVVGGTHFPRNFHRLNIYEYVCMVHTFTFSYVFMVCIIFRFFIFGWKAPSLTDTYSGVIELTVAQSPAQRLLNVFKAIYFDICRWWYSPVENCKLIWTQ